MMTEVHVVVSDDSSGPIDDEDDNHQCDHHHYHHRRRRYTDDDADDEDDDVAQDSVSSSGDSVSVVTHPLDLEGSIVVGGNIRRTSICSCSSSRSSSGSSGSGLSVDHNEHNCPSCSARSSRGYSPTRDSGSEEEEDEDDRQPYPGYRPVTLFCLTQSTHPRDWCLKLVINPWFERMCMMVILLNCVTLGMYQPCADGVCSTNRCKILQISDDVIFGFFAIEMIIKITAMGAFGKNAYLAETWNRLDFFIVFAGSLEYCLDMGNMNFSAIRTIRVLRPLRAINRIPSMRILVMLLLDTLPMLGNVLLLCFFVFFIFGIVAVQMWAGVLRQRCYMELPENISFPGYVLPYYLEKVKVLNPVVPYYQTTAETDKDFICSLEKDNGIHRCNDLPMYRYLGKQCNSSASPFSANLPSNVSCINWNQYYTNCRAGDRNPFQGAISFDNIGLAWVAIFLVISLEGWTDIMYYVQDAHSFWDWIYFVLLIVVGSFFMINLCLVVIATQFSETKKRELERMRIERALGRSSSTLTSATNGSEPTGCYSQMFKYLTHLGRKARRKILRFCRRHSKRKRTRSKKADAPCSITLRRKRTRPKWMPGQSSMKNDSSSRGTFDRESSVEVKSAGGVLVAPCASPEVSDIDIGSSPRDVELTFSDSSKPRMPMSTLSSDKFGNSGRYIPKRRGTVPQQHSTTTGTSDSSRKTGAQLTCTELLAFGAAQGAATAGFANHFAMQSLYCNLNKNEKHLSAPQLLFYSSENDTETSRIKGGGDAYWSTESSTSEVSDIDKIDDSELTILGRCCRWYNDKQSRLKFFVDHRYFQRGILTAILVNTLSMGIEYHNQPEGLTLAVEISNVIFTIVFLIEMIMKMCAEGLFSYISSGYNLFDGIIVILSVVELCQSSGSGLSVLRTFRLLRILKLVRFMPALRRQLVVMLRTVDNVAIFFALLILFIFIFSILGMNLFGCKFCQKYPDGTMRCDRKNFDSLLWAIVTVFQILTQEDWNVVLFNGMEKTSHWAALYFVALMTFGNYVLFNLLVAILVEGFSAEEDKRSVSRESHCSNCEKLDIETSTDKEQFDGAKWTSVGLPKNNMEKEMKMKGIPYVLTVVKPDQCPNLRDADTLCYPPLITHTAATPQGSPNATLIMQRDVYNRLYPDKAFNLSDSSIISIDKSTSPNSMTSEVVQLNGLPVIQVASINIPTINLSPSPQNGARNSVVLTLSRQSSVGSNGSRRSSLGLCFNLQRKGSKNWKSHRRKKGESESSENDSGSDEMIPNNKQNHLCASEHGHCNGSIPTLQNSSNNKRSLNTQNGINSPGMLSPRNSIKSVSLSHYNSLSENNDRWSRSSRHTSLNDSIRSRPTLSPTNTNFEHSNLPSRQNSICSVKAEAKIPNEVDKTPAQASLKDANNCELTEKLCWFIEPTGWVKEREDYSLFVFSKSHCLRRACVYLAENKYFDYFILIFIALNCITLAMERPSIPPDSWERLFLSTANYTFTIIFTFEMAVKVLAKGLWYGPNAYFKSGWNIMDGFVVGISLVDFFLTLVAESSPRIFGILRVFRLLRSLRPLRVINRAPGLKLVVQTLLSSLRPIGNIVLICCTFFVIFGILGVQLFKGSMYYCEGPNVTHVRNKFDCEQDRRNIWQNRKYNFDNLGQALMALFVLSSKDGWVNIMYTGLDAVGVDQQPIENYNEWRLLYFISFLLLVAFFVLNMFVGVVVENFHRCRERQEREEKARRAAKRAKKMDKKRRKMREPPYYINYSRPRLLMHNIIISKYFDLVIAAVIGLNVITMAMEFYMMPYKLEYALKVFNYFFTAVFILEACMKIFALGVIKYLKNRWNQLDIFIVGLSIAGIILEKMESDLISINPTIIRVMRVLRISRVLKLLKMAKGIRALLDTVMQALPQVGNLGLLFFLLFFIFAALGVELFGRLECTDELPCEGLGEHAHFKDFGMSYLTLFRVATGDNWNGIMKDTLRENCDHSSDCIKNCCISSVIAPLYFVIFVLMAQFVLVNVVVAVLMKHLEESHKQMDDDMEMDAELERELAAEAHQKKIVELGEHVKQAIEVCQQASNKPPKSRTVKPRPLLRIPSLPSNFVFSFDNKDDNSMHLSSLSSHVARRTTDCIFQNQSDPPQTAFNYIAEDTSKLAQNVNLREATPEGTNDKVTVADLSPAHSAISSNGSPKITHENKSPMFQNFPIIPPNLSSNYASYASHLGVESPFLDDSANKVTERHDSSLFAAGRAFSIPSVEIRRDKSPDFDEKQQYLDIPMSDFTGGSASRIHKLGKVEDTPPVIQREATSVPYHHMVKPLLDYNSSHLSLSHSDTDGDNIPLIVRRLKKKLLKQEAESSMSSQSDIPDNSRDKSMTTDSTSLEC